MYIIIFGNPVDGFSFFGPFTSHEAAVEVAERSHHEADWWIAELSGL